MALRVGPALRRARRSRRVPEGQRIRLQDEAHAGVPVPRRGEIAVVARPRSRVARPGGSIVVWPGERETTLCDACRGVVVPARIAPLDARAGVADPDRPPASAATISGERGPLVAPSAAAVAEALRDHVLALVRQLDASDRLREVATLRRAAVDDPAELMAELADTGAEPRARAPGPWPILRAGSFLRARIAEAFTMDDVAAPVGISLRSLQQGLRRSCLTTPRACVAPTAAGAGPHAPAPRGPWRDRHAPPRRGRGRPSGPLRRGAPRV